MINSTRRSDSIRSHRHGTPVTDDGTETFFYRAHTTIWLFITIGCLAYVTFWEDQTEHEDDWEYNTKRGLIAACLCFVAFGVTQARDGPFKRPHAAIWRVVLCLSVIYFLFLVVLLFQSRSNARKLIAYFDHSLGTPPDYTAYGHDCDIYDPVNFPDEPFHNFIHNLDGFVTAHFVGWVFKMLMIRDFWMTNVLSLLFELLEYTLEHQLPNFSECWWDHWILDFIVCNGGGIVCGYYIMRYFKNKEYNWRGLAKQRTAKDKASRIIAQFSPHSWVTFHWNMTTNFKNWIYVNIVILVYAVSELNTFYLKTVLWIPAGHRVVLTRLWLCVFWGAPATREFYDYVAGETDTIGQQFWVYAAICLTETMIVMKFGSEIVSKPFPEHIKTAWIWAVAVYVAWSIWKFQIFYRQVKPGTEEAKKAERQGECIANAALPRVGMVSSKSSSDEGSPRKDIRRRRMKKAD